jgi:RNA polymerase sigma factor (sigma-70 family)
MTMDETPATRPSLLARIRDPRDEPAWREFTEIYGPLVVRLARAKGLQEADALDLAQEVFRSVARAADGGGYDPARGSFRGWLFGIARNKAIDLLAAGRRQTQGTGDTDMQDLLEAQPAPSQADSDLFESEYRRRLFNWAADRVRAGSTAAAWRAFEMAGLEGRPAAEVAECLGTTVGTVYYYKSQIMTRLRRLIEEIEGDGRDADLGRPAR